MGIKKNDGYIISPRFFYSPESIEQTTQNIDNKIINNEEQPKKEEYQETIGGISAYSLKSIEAKREAAQIRQNQVIDISLLPKNSYSEEDFAEVWRQYIQFLTEKGERLQISNLGTNIPKIENDIIYLQV